MTNRSKKRSKRATAATPSLSSLQLQHVPVPVLTSISVVCRGHSAVAALLHVASTIESFLLRLSPKWTLERAAESKLVHLLDRLATQEWAGVTPAFREARFKYGVDHAIRDNDAVVLSWWMEKYLPGNDDFVVEAVFASAKLKLLQWLYDQDKLPLDHLCWTNKKTRYHLPAARWVLEHVNGALIKLYVDLLTDLEDLKWAHQQEKKGSCVLSALDELLDYTVRFGNVDVVLWIHENRSERCPKEAFGEAVANGHLEIAKWLHAHYPVGYFDDPWKATCDFELIQWVTEQFKWKAETHRVVWIDNTILNTISKNESEIFVDHDLKIVEFLYSIRSEIDRETYLLEVMPLSRGPGYRTVPRYYPPSPTEAMNTAARVGNLPMLQWLHAHRKDGCTTYAINEAAAMNHLDVVKWLHENRYEGCTEEAMSRAIANGHLEMVQWLHANRSEGYEPDSMDTAAERGYFDIIKWLHINRSEGCTESAIDNAAHSGHFEIVKWLHENRFEGCTDQAIDYAAGKGHLDIIEYLHAHRDEGCSDSAFQDAASRSHIDVMKWLLDHGLANTDDAMHALYNAAVTSGNLESTKFLCTYCKLNYDGTLVDKAVSWSRFDVAEWFLRNAVKIDSVISKYL